MNQTTAPTLPGLEDKKPKPGEIESKLKEQIQTLEKSNVITNAHAGSVALALHAAKEVDHMGFAGAPSGRANMLRAAREIFEMLPQPEDQAGAGALAAVLAIIKDDEDDEDEPEPV